jgi:glycosyltransferase involved in cell wall biosynthesis
MTLPPVTIVFLVFNRREELRTSLREMLFETDYPADRLDVIVVDNASTDGSAAMVRDEFPRVRLIERATNRGVSAWNDGFAVATGDYVLALDDDCYIPGDGLRRAVEAAQAHAADLVSFTVQAASDPSYRFTTHEYDTGLLTFWGCSVLFRREVLEVLGGYDPQIFVWANELEFMLRFFDRGFRHLHLPEVASVHMKPLPHARPDYYTSPAYPRNMANIAYVAGKRLHARHAVGALIAMLATTVRNGYLVHPSARYAQPSCVAGFVRGLRHRDPVRSANVSRAFRLNFHEYASPWWWSRPPQALILALLLHVLELAWLRVRRVLPRRGPDRHERYFRERARFYPDEAASLQL